MPVMSSNIGVVTLRLDEAHHLEAQAAGSVVPTEGATGNFVSKLWPGGVS